jgi:hypothetical protein
VTTRSPDDELPPSEPDFRFVERQIRLHVDIAQWHPNPHALEAKPECWRRAFAMAPLLREGVQESFELARRLDVDERLVAEDRVLVPYLDRTIAGLLSVLGWYVDTGF